MKMTFRNFFQSIQTVGVRNGRSDDTVSKEM